MKLQITTCSSPSWPVGGVKPHHFEAYSGSEITFLVCSTCHHCFCFVFFYLQISSFNARMSLNSKIWISEGSISFVCQILNQYYLLTGESNWWFFDVFLYCFLPALRRRLPANVPNVLKQLWCSALRWQLCGAAVSMHQSWAWWGEWKGCFMGSSSFSCFPFTFSIHPTCYY